jgi:FixJ family two-component response regulator
MPDRVLIAVVDDSESLREAMQSLLKALGFSAESFPSAEDFLKSGKLQATSCLIADVQMPGISGVELHRRLISAGNPIPTILITAYPDERVRSRALQDGVRYYLIKPVRENDLLSCIQSCLGGAAGNLKAP